MLYGTPKQRTILRTNSVGTGFILLHTDNVTVLEAEVYVDRSGVFRRTDTGEPLFPMTLREALPGGLEAITTEVAPQVEQMPDQQPFKARLPQTTDDNQVTDQHSQDPEVRAGFVALSRLDQLLQPFLPSAQQLLLHGDGGDLWAFDQADQAIHIMIEQLYTILRALGERESLDTFD
jgi:hypothetical protein